MRRLLALAFLVALVAAPVVALDREEREPRLDLVDRLVSAFVDLFDKAGGCLDPYGLCQPAVPPAPPGGTATQSEPVSDPVPADDPGA